MAPKVVTAERSSHQASALHRQAENGIISLLRGVLFILAVIVWVIPLFILHLLVSKVTQASAEDEIEDGSTSL